MIRDIGRSIGSAVFETVGRAVSRAQERRPLPVDLLESEEAFLAVFDAPGATGSDVQVRYDEGAIQVRIDRFREFHEGFEMVFPGRGLSLDGRVDLPEGTPVEAAEASATLTETGELHVRVPKVEPSEPGTGDGQAVTVTAGTAETAVEDPDATDPDATDRDAEELDADETDA